METDVERKKRVKERQKKIRQERGKEYRKRVAEFHRQVDKKVNEYNKIYDKKLISENNNIYIISNPVFNGRYKVGITKDIDKRLTSYQTGDPERRYKLEYSIETDKAEQVESYIHKKYKADYEWVKGDIKEIIEDINNYEE